MNFGVENVDRRKVEASPEFKCFPNAVKAAVEIYKKSEGEVLPRIWRVVFPELKDSHAYLQVGDVVYNRGVTWPDGKYPDLSLEELKEKALDVTTAVLTQTYLEFGEDYREEKMGFREAVESLGYGNREEMRKLMEEMMAKSVSF